MLSKNMMSVAQQHGNKRKRIREKNREKPKARKQKIINLDDSIQQGINIEGQ